jgi:tetrapyrrole methylase family protein/MazG family protein
MERLYDIVRHLRSPEGCAWDRKQTSATLRSSLLDEAYECVDAIDREDAGNLREELGDVALIVAMIAVIEEERGRLTLASALEDICEKLIRRHPHVFGDKRESDVDRIVEQWQEIKRGENGKAAPSSALDGVPASMPPLERALGLQKKAAHVGFDWPEAAPVFDKLQEEIAETRQALGDPAALEHEVGDLLFTVVNLARLLRVDPARALAASNRKFESRFRELERRLAASGRGFKDVDLARMDLIWEEIKKEG